MNDIFTIAANLATQDGRMTHLPIYMCQQKQRYPVPEGYSDTGEWYDIRAGETVTDPEEFAQLTFLDEGGDLDDKRYRWVWYRDHWEAVQPFFTEAGAKRYIEINGHNLREPRIYVESGYRNEEWETVRKHLMALPPPLPVLGCGHRGFDSIHPAPDGSVQCTECANQMRNLT